MASEHAIVGYTKQLAYGCSRKGIRVNAIAAGVVRTPMYARGYANGGKMASLVAEETPVGRWAEPKEVASLILYLASGAAEYIHGAVIPIDDGWTIK